MEKDEDEKTKKTTKEMFVCRPFCLVGLFVAHVAELLFFLSEVYVYGQGKLFLEKKKKKSLKQSELCKI